MIYGLLIAVTLWEILSYILLTKNIFLGILYLAGLIFVLLMVAGKNAYKESTGGKWI